MDETVSQNEQPEKEQKELVKAGFLNRTIARVIDFIIVIALYEIIPVLGYIAGFIYLIIADGLFEGKSIGKRLMGLKVLIISDDETSIPCGYKESIFRNLPFAAGYLLFGMLNVIPIIGGLISFLIILVIVVFETLVVLGNEKGMRLGDEIAKSFVIEDKQVE